MKPHSISLTIDNPCTQNWDGMIVNDNGKFCTSCNKNVIDFSTLSDAEIIKLLSNTTSNVCGRLNSQQLNRVIHPKAETQSGLNKFWLSFSLTALLSSLGIVKSTAQTTTKTEQLPINNVSVDDSTLTKIKYTLRDSITNEPIPFVKIVIKELNITCRTNFDGSFEFMVPNTYKEKNVHAIASLENRTTQVLTIILNNNLSKYSFSKEEYANIAGGVRISCSNPPSLWQRIKNKFSRK